MGISICIPTYNRLPYLKDLLASIVDGFCDYPYEIIIADGGSTDGTLEYLRALDNVTLIEQGELTGAVKAFNACFKIAKYKYTYWSADDYILVPKVFINACKLMDEYEDIGFVSIKTKESIYEDLPGIELFNFLVLSGTHTFRTSVLKEINYLDEFFRTYGVDDDTSFAVLNSGYTIIFTKEVGIIHNQIEDELRIVNANNVNKDMRKREEEYLVKKWSGLNSRIDKYMNAFLFKKYKVKIFVLAYKAIFKFKLLRFLPPISRKTAIKFCDWLLKQCAVFEAKEYSHLKDFYLAQKLPKEILK